MMTYARKFKTLSVANILLLLFIAGGVAFSPARRQDRSERRSLVSDKVEIMAIKISGAENAELSKSGNAWTLRRGAERLPADANKVSAFLEALKAVKRLQAVAKGKESWKDFGLEGGAAKRIQIFSADDKAVADFSVGKNSSATSDVYITFPDSAAAYKAGSAFASYLEGTDAAWLDLRLMPALDIKAVDSFDFRGSLAFDEKTTVASGYSLVRSQQDWKTAGPAAPMLLDTVKVETMLRSLISARGEDFAPAGTALGPVGATLTLNVGNGAKIAVEIGPIGADKRFPVKTGDGGRIMYVASWALREGFKPLEDLLRK